jgi:hypothetical protein
MNKQRLLDVARACREAPVPAKFTMENFANACGTPACALGHYAVRRDLQDKFELKTMPQYHVPWLVFEGKTTGYDHTEVCEWFDIAPSEATELFAADGCGGQVETVEDEYGDEDEELRPITDPIKAAEYIEDFVRRHEQEAP